MNARMHLRDDAPRADGDSHQGIARDFVKVLAAELVEGRIDLPSPSTVVVRVRQALADPAVTAARLGLVVSSEPTLAARVIRLANSAALNPAGTRVRTLQRAIAIVGLSTVRLATLAHVIDQLKKLNARSSIAAELEQIWLRSVATAATACAVARRSRVCLPDEALLAGLMVGTGRMYILSRASAFHGLRDESEAYEAIVSEWHADAARAVLENWDMPESVVAAVHRHAESAYAHRGPPDLIDVLIAANVLVESGLEAHSIDERLTILPAAERLALSPDAWCDVLMEAQRGADELLAALDA